MSSVLYRLDYKIWRKTFRKIHLRIYPNTHVKFRLLQKLPKLFQSLNSKKSPDFRLLNQWQYNRRWEVVLFLTKWFIFLPRQAIIQSKSPFSQNEDQAFEEGNEHPGDALGLVFNDSLVQIQLPRD